ncbi:Transglutaminase-like superfamily protein [Amycolatopsis marina]|uniref:Transglutaminase-like superfamily protein n=1 Tax=Amycolatopsis marina TaxID=490629 RepID=A0A1I1AHU5_9PSEU|nr:transglutaminase domain-containing protein [Amycolatopsis marina]SFB35913.1 Transglutaminase-like superfamily protein [Amycolatopsis marina]
MSTFSLRAVTTGCVVLAAAVAGLLFAPVFGLPALLLPLGLLAVAVFAVAVLCSRHEALVPWRPLLVTGAGLLVVTETVLWPTTIAGLPSGETVRALVAGATDSWQLALQSTWPARPDAALLLFVPLLVLLASVLGIELLYRLGVPLLALAPSLAVVVLSQLYAALSGPAAVLAALAYAAAAGAVLVSTRADPVGGTTSALGKPEPRRVGPALLRAAPPVVLAVACAIVAGVLAPTTAPRYSLKHDQLAPVAQSRVTSPLEQIAYRMAHPGAPVFEVSGAAGVDRWPVVVLDNFDGVNWTPGARYRRLGTELAPSPSITSDVRARSARIDPVQLDGPWLPSQTWPAGVRGIDLLVEEQQGTLLAPQAGGAPYTLTWWEPETAPGELIGSAIDPHAPGGLGAIGDVPPGVAELARDAVHGMRPTFQSALVLDDFLRKNYRLATGQHLPTGHSWPQLTEFLLRDKRGTSEQFAAAYVVLARVLGIPARLVVGFRAPAQRGPDGRYTVRNADVLAWPEVAVDGVGWVPLDPSGAATTSGQAAGAGLAAAAAQARAQLPPQEDLRDPPVAPQQQEVAGPESDSPVGPVLVGVLAGIPLLVLLAWVVGVPTATAWRARRRRRRAGTGAVIGAWEEVRDRLRAHGVAVSAGMTVRDLATAAAGVFDRTTVEGVRSLSSTVDIALWSGMEPDKQRGREAWAAVRTVRRGLAGRGWRARIRAAVDPRVLLPPRP